MDTRLFGAGTMVPTLSTPATGERPSASTAASLMASATPVSAMRAATGAAAASSTTAPSPTSSPSLGHQRLQQDRDQQHDQHQLQRRHRRHHGEADAAAILGNERKLRPPSRPARRSGDEGDPALSLANNHGASGRRRDRARRTLQRRGRDRCASGSRSRHRRPRHAQPAAGHACRREMPYRRGTRC